MIPIHHSATQNGAANGSANGSDYSADPAAATVATRRTRLAGRDINGLRTR